MPGGFPEYGEYPLSFWASFFVVDVAQVRLFVRENDIPFRKYCGDEKWIESTEMRAAVKKLRPSECPTKRGGSRRKE
jgi:hypothetical protein